MRTVTIHTSNNVAIDYDLATVQQRIMAFGIDLLVLFGWVLLSSVMVRNQFSYENQEVARNLLMIPAMAYSLIFESFVGGQSLGKRAMGLKVIKLDGRPASFNECFQRWIFRLLEIWLSLGAVAVLFISSGGRAQRIGDILAQTAVINTNPRYNLKVKDLLSMEEKKDSTPRYHGVLRYTDEDMLLVKSSLDRAEKYNNPAHHQAVLELAERVANQLPVNTNEIKGKEMVFLRKVLQDYIVLTRS